MQRPLLKWVGGKTQLLGELLPYMRPRRRYIEPFVGGAAVALQLRCPTIVCDVDEDLVETYRTVQYSPIAVSRVLEDHRWWHGERYYYLIRDMHRPQSPVERAARCIYLSKLGFNGLWRKNKSGGFNVPLGRGRPSALPDEAELLRLSSAMSLWRIEHGDFEQVISMARDGDVVYADPPYVGTFAYGGFTDADQVRLRDALDEAWMRGASVVTTNSIDALRWYEGGHWSIRTIDERRRVGATTREAARCIICARRQTWQG